MKKLLTFFAFVFTMFACGIIVACGNKKPIRADENTVMIVASDTSFDFENKTLKDYMEYLQENGKLTFSASNGMVTSMNGKSNTNNSFWMLYTSDSENANETWGTFDLEGSVYGSSTLGMEALFVKEGCIYIWAFQTF